MVICDIFCNKIIILQNIKIQLFIYLKENLFIKSMEARMPLLAGYSETTTGKLPVSLQGLSLSRKGIIVTAFGNNPDGEGTILHLLEQAGISGKCTVVLPDGIKVKAVQPIDLRGNIKGEKILLNNNSFDFNLNKYSPASFLLIF